MILFEIYLFFKVIDLFLAILHNLFILFISLVSSKQLVSYLLMILLQLFMLKIKLLMFNLQAHMLLFQIIMFILKLLNLGPQFPNPLISILLNLIDPNQLPSTIL